MIRNIPLTAAYTGASAVAMCAVTYNAYREWKLFLPTILSLQNNQISVLVVFNFFISLTYLAFKLVQYIFFGALRVVEADRLYERTWFAVTETIFAMSLFRNSLDTFFVLHLTAMVLSKGWHWILWDRVDYMDTAGPQTRMWHFRINGICALLAAIDFGMICHTLPVALSGPSMLIFFCVEYVIMGANLMTAYAKYLLYTRDATMQGQQWENKSMYLFYLEVFSDLSKLGAYMFFCVSIYRHYGIPLYLVRDILLISRSAYSRIRDVINYRRAAKELNARFPDVSLEEVRRGDTLCVVCREDMLEWESDGAVRNETLIAEANERIPNPQYRPKKLPCGHIFHYHCLRSWLERQQVCPTCRRSVLTDNSQNSNTNSSNNAANNTNNNNNDMNNAPINNNDATHNDTGGVFNVNRTEAQSENRNADDINVRAAQHRQQQSNVHIASAPTNYQQSLGSSNTAQQSSEVLNSAQHAYLTPLIPVQSLLDSSVDVPLLTAQLGALNTLDTLDESELRQSVEQRLGYVRKLDRKLTEIMYGLNSYLAATESPDRVHSTAGSSENGSKGKYKRNVASTVTSSNSLLDGGDLD